MWQQQVVSILSHMLGTIVQIAYLLPKRRVDNVSETCKELGEQQQSRVVLELPPCWENNILRQFHYGKTLSSFILITPKDQEITAILKVANCTKNPTKAEYTDHESTHQWFLQYTSQFWVTVRYMGSCLCNKLTIGGQLSRWAHWICASVQQTSHWQAQEFYL